MEPRVKGILEIKPLPKVKQRIIHVLVRVDWDIVEVDQPLVHKPVVDMPREESSINRGDVLVLRDRPPHLRGYPGGEDRVMVRVVRDPRVVLCLREGGS